MADQIVFHALAGISAMLSSSRAASRGERRR
jgi:hypothetical protein